MEHLITYFRCIILFLIFINFITILLPNKKYKNYIDFVLGLILIGIVISPITKIFQFNNFDVSSQFTTENTYQNKYTDTTQYTSTLYELQLSKVVSQLIYSNFNITPTEIVVTVSHDDLSKIETISMKVQNVENEDIKNIKNLLSSAYNLSVDNILITISN